MKKFTVTLALITFSAVSAQQSVKNDSLKIHSVQEVLISKKVFKKESDRFVYDISNAPLAKGSSTFDILKQTPMVSSSDESTLKIAGKNNAVIYINGRKSNMDAASLVQFLKNTPAENIQKIEVITMPGSEYQVESSDGIINIILKKKSTDGFNGNMRMSSTANKYTNNSSSFSGNYRKDKLGISANLSGSANIQPQYFDLQNGNSLATNRSVGFIDDPNQNLGGYLNIDYQLNDNSNIALSWNTWANKSYGATINLFNTLKTFDNEGNLLSTEYTNSRNREDARSYNNNVNLNYELKTDSLGSKLNLNAAYLNYKRFQHGDNNTILANADGTDVHATKNVLQSQPQIINSFAATADYNRKFENDFSASVGANFNKTNTDNDILSITTDFIYDGTGQLIDKDPTATPNHFIYDETIYGFYLTLEKKFSDKFSGKSGARYEITGSLGTSDNSKDPALRRIEREYSNFLPYLSLNYAINDNQNLSYAFSSRMRRPSFWELNPVKNLLTEYNYTQNNPFVKASATYNQELTYMYKNSYFVVLNHSYLKDVITQVPLQGYPVSPDGTVGAVNELRYIRTNFGDQQEMSAALGVNKSFFKQTVSVNFNIGMQHNINRGSLSVDPTTGDRFLNANGDFVTYTNETESTSLFIQSNNTIRLDKKKTWFLGVNYFYVDKQQIELGLLKNMMSLDLNLKKIWNDWTFSVNVNDVFRTNVVEVNDRQANGNFNYILNDTYRQNFGATIVYNFGNKKVKKVRDIEDASKDVKSRTR